MIFLGEWEQGMGLFGMMFRQVEMEQPRKITGKLFFFLLYRLACIGRFMLGFGQKFLRDGRDKGETE